MAKKGFLIMRKRCFCAVLELYHEMTGRFSVLLFLWLLKANFSCHVVLGYTGSVSLCPVSLLLNAQQNIAWRVERHPPARQVNGIHLCVCTYVCVHMRVHSHAHTVHSTCQPPSPVMSAVTRDLEAPQPQ